MPQRPPPPHKQQLSGVAAAVRDAGGRLGRAVGDVFRRLRIDDTLFYSGLPNQRRSSAGKNNGGRPAPGAPSPGKEGATGGGDPLGATGKFARSQGSMNLSATYDSRTNDVESSVVARGDLWRAEASHSSGAGGSAPRSASDGANLFLVQLGPVLFVRDTTLLFPVHLSKRHLIWYGFERKVRRLISRQKFSIASSKQRIQRAKCLDLRAQVLFSLAEWSSLGLPCLLVGSQEMVLHVHVMPEPVCLCKSVRNGPSVSTTALQFSHANF